MLAKIGPILAATPISGHFELDDPQAVFDAPVTELYSRYFAAADVPPIQGEVLEKTKEFAKGLHSIGATATATAWSQVAEKDGVQMQMEVLLVGWKSIEEHLEGKKEKIFTDTVGLIKVHKPLQEQLVHVKFLQ